MFYMDLKQRKLKEIEQEQRNYNPPDEHNISNEPVDFTVKDLQVNFSNLVSVIDDVSSKYTRDQKIIDLSKEINKYFGTLVKNKREGMNKSQHEISEVSNVSRSFISDIEGGKAEVSLTTFLLLSKALNLNMAQSLNYICQKTNLSISDSSVVNTDNSNSTFLKNYKVQIGVKYFIDVSTYSTSNGVEVIFPEKELEYYKNKYGQEITFKIDRQESKLTMYGGSQQVYWKIVSSNNDYSLALKK